MNHSITIAGYGGQGVLFAGKFIAYIGMLQGQEVSWLPSYGPEMRGGTCNCGVIISKTPIGSPVVLSPDLVLAMNLPSYDKFEPLAQAGAKIVVDTELSTRPPARTDVETFGLPATRIADENGLHGLSNIIMAGQLIKQAGLCSYDVAVAAMEKTVDERKSEMLEKNIKAIKLGMEL
jgi:2-oxoglutarate ferredoxin oxidoreductase subunit gamma